MKNSRVLDRTRLQALKISEIRSSTTEFNLYLDVGSDIIPYAQGIHQWSVAEKLQLLKDGQFILLYASEDAEQVSHYLEASPAEPLGPLQTHSPVDTLLSDGIAEFLKTRYAYPVSVKQALTFKSLSGNLLKYLDSHPELGILLWRLHEHDPYTYYHSARVAAYAVGISAVMQPDEPGRMWDLALGCFLHDLGNIHVDAKLLQRAGPLLTKEWDQIRRHPDEGLGLLQGIALNPFVKEIILHHHERMDGGGYPHRLPGGELPIEVRIVSFAEVFTALTQPRQYQSRRSTDAALQLIESSLLNFLDPQLLDPLLTLLDQNQAKEDKGRPAI